MFCEEDNIEKTTLRQGDIIANIHLLGALNIRNICYSYAFENHEEILNWMVPKSPKFGDAMVLSHSCEIALENKIKVTSIILAPLRDVNTATDPKRVQELIDTNLIDKERPQSSFLKYFYIPPNSKLNYQKGAVVDFSKLFSVRNKAYDHILSKKILQLSENYILSMSLKLALYFHRYHSTELPQGIQSLPQP